MNFFFCKVGEDLGFVTTGVVKKLVGHGTFEIEFTILNESPKTSGS